VRHRPGGPTPQRAPGRAGAPGPAPGSLARATGPLITGEVER